MTINIDNFVPACLAFVITTYIPVSSFVLLYLGFLVLMSTDNLVLIS